MHGREAGAQPDSMKKATATSHGNNRFTDSPGAAGDAEIALELAGLILVADGIAGLREFVYEYKRVGWSRLWTVCEPCGLPC